MFSYAKPTEVGVCPKQIKKYISILEKYGLSTHNVIMARGNKIFFEKYWEPFNVDFKHRLYSCTKSFVSIAIGFLVQDKKVSLNDKIIDYFKDDIPEDLLSNVGEQSIKDMLMMSTGFPSNHGNWFVEKPEDRVKYYFESSSSLNAGKYNSKKAGSFFEYDSNGSFILGALVERVSGMSLTQFLKEKLFDKIGALKDAYILKCPGGHSWSDSALVCTPMDFLKTARFVLNYGKVDGKQILSEEYLKEATSNLINNSLNGSIAFDKFGYGYQFWRTWNDSFFFNGMGCQFAVCVPNKDFILVYNGDNQGIDGAKMVIIDRFFEEIVDTASDNAIEENINDEKELKDYCKDLKLRFADGKTYSDKVSSINGKIFIMNDNPMKISQMRFTFEKDEGILYYTNAQGEKSLRFGFGKNVYTEFPEEGYSDDVGSVFAAGNYYKCASSAGWVEEDKLCIMVQIIDEYFGRMYMSVSFKKQGEIAVLCTKTAEDFLDEYKGYADGVEK